MKCSVIMTTYNGEKYVIQQLDSIRLQSKKADEVLIFDDCSQDETIDIIIQYINKYNLIGWKLIINKINKGWQKNFIDGIKIASNDIIFLSDQDDIWHRDKIRIMMEAMEINTNIDLLICKYNKFTTETDLNISVKTNANIVRLMSTAKLVNCIYPGCTYCFRKNFFDLISTAWIHGFPHDRFIFIAAWINDSIYLCDNVLHYFRRHNDSVTTIAPPVFDVDKRLSALKHEQQIYNNFITIYGDKHCNEFKEYGEWLRLRIRLIDQFSLLTSISLIKRKRFYPSILTYFNDNYVSIKKLFKLYNNR